MANYKLGHKLHLDGFPDQELHSAFYDTPAL